MFKKRIPARFEYDSMQIIKAIRGVIGEEAEIYISQNGVVTIDKITLSSQQTNEIKNKVLPLLNNIDDITI